MPVRIYALAKDWKMDSKELADICLKAGIVGKGSALASLDDDEVVRLKDFLNAQNAPKKGREGEGGLRPGPGGRATQAPAEPLTYSRADYIAPRVPGKIRVLEPSAKKPAPKPEEKTPERELEQPAVAAEIAPAFTSPAEIGSAEIGSAEIGSAEIAPTVVAPIVAEPIVAEPVVLAPTVAAQSPVSPPTVTATAAPVASVKAAAPPVKLPPQRRKPVIKLAELPDVVQPTGPATEEIKAQKPDIRLTKDHISGYGVGIKAPLHDLTQAHEQKKKEKEKQQKERATDADRRSREKGAKDWPGKQAREPLVEPPQPVRGKGGPAKKHVDVKADEEQPDRGLAGMASARADRQKARKDRAVVRSIKTVGDEDDGPSPLQLRRPKTLVRKRGASAAALKKDHVSLTLPITVRSFSEAAGIPSAQVLKTLMSMGTLLNINGQMAQDMAELVASELGIQLDVKQPASLEDTLIASVEQTPDDPADLQPRPPVVTFLGHVDHGKTSLLDYIIGTNVVAGEAGGITQHIRAYEISKDGRKISFVDTPGHEAFTEMRARGANVTDIAVLVIAADDGIMPQTEEALSHARAAEVPIIVALNKIDLPGANPDRVLQQLAALNLLPSEWGGEVEVVRTSAITGQGMDTLLETILVTAELREYKANPRRPAVGVCLEAEQEAGRGVIAKLIVKNGTLEVGDVLVCGSAHGKVKAMYDTLRPSVLVKKAGPSTPVNVTGLDIAPQAGDKFNVLQDITKAREIAASRANLSRERSLSGITMRVSFEEFQRRLAEGKLVAEHEVVTLNLIIRADVRGSIEAIQKELTRLDHPEVQIKILQASVGGITAADVMLAHASQAVIVGFNVIPDEAARALAEDKQVEIRRYDIIYKVTDDIKALLEGKLKPEERVVELGQALVKRVFVISRVGAVAGCYVVRGSIKRNCKIRVNRDGRTIGEYPLESLKREKDDAREVARGLECGIKLAGFNDIKQDDILEAYEIEEVARTL